MEALLQTDAYGQSYSIICMELCVKDLAQATSDLLKKFPDLLRPDHCPPASWKFPHLSITDIEVASIIEQYRQRSLSDSQRYQELLELLIDRVCFSVILVSRLLSSVLGQDYRQEQEENEKAITVTQVERPKLSLKIPSSSQNQQTKGESPNISLILQQMYDNVSLLVDVMGTKSSKSRKPETEEIFSRNIGDSTSKTSQTEVSDANPCLTCSAALSLLRILASMSTQLLQALDPSLSSESARLSENGSISWDLSHREFVTLFCKAVQNDFKALSSKVASIIREKSKKEKELENLPVVQKKADALAKTNEELSLKLKNSTSLIEAQKKSRLEVYQQYQNQLKASSQLQTQLQQKKEEAGVLQGKIKALSESLQESQKAHSEVQEEFGRSEQARSDLESQLSVLKRQVLSLEHELSSKSEALSQKLEEVAQLKQAKKEETTREEMKALLEKAKKQLEACRRAEEGYKREKLEGAEKCRKLEKELSACKEHLELLSMYPDLNGPINPPSAEDVENPLLAMENQVRSNSLRIQILQEQTDGLNKTLARCRSNSKRNSVEGKEGC